MLRLSFDRVTRIARTSTVAAALAAGLTFGLPISLASAQEVKAIHENGMVVTPAQVGKSYFSTLSVRNPDTIQYQNGTLVEVWKISGSRGQCVDVTMKSDDFDSLLEIYSVHPHTGELKLLERNDDDGAGLNARIAGRLPQSGAYYIVATSSDGEDPDARYDIAFNAC